ncbi:MAG: hypothetical protein GDA53_08065 [Rhodobacteraceae bacterium]|nr:hypothetical protein [Paracoccaceae bacterium]
MSDISELEARFEVALAALCKGNGNAETLEKRVRELENALVAATGTADKAQNTLKEAKAELADLKNEVSTQDELDKEEMEALNRRVENLTKAWEDAYADRQRVRQHNQHVRRLNGELRKANANNSGDPGMINESLQAEVDFLKAERENDVKEINGILARLKPLVEGAPDG